LRQRLETVIYDFTVVYTAALCGWQLNGNDDPISVLLHLIMLAGVTLMVDGILKERENKQ
jgi:hypothetical protein